MNDDELLQDGDDTGEPTIHDVVRIASRNPDRFIKLTEMFCSPETQYLTKKSLKAWGIERGRRNDQGAGNRSARGRKNHRD